MTESRRPNPQLPTGDDTNDQATRQASLAESIVRHVRSRGSTGCTVEEIADALQVQMQDAYAAVTPLLRSKVFLDTCQRQKRRDGKLVAVLAFNPVAVKSQPVPTLFDKGRRSVECRGTAARSTSAGGGRRDTVLKFVRGRGIRGATRDEIAEGLSLPVQSVCSPVLALIERGELREKGQTRTTRYGKPAAILVAKASRVDARQRVSRRRLILEAIQVRGDSGATWRELVSELSLPLVTVQEVVRSLIESGEVVVDGRKRSSDAVMTAIASL